MGRRHPVHQHKHKIRLGNTNKSRSSGLMGGPDGQPLAKAPSFDGLLVSWEPGTTNKERSYKREGLGFKLREDIYTRAMREHDDGVLEWLELPDGLNADEAIAELEKQPGVAYAEKNWIIQPQEISNDLYYTNGSLWGMYGNNTSPSNTYGSQAAEAWANGQIGSSSVVVGIIDEGYQYTHPDLSANAGINTGELAGDGLDNDLNGYIDDVYGWDFDGNNNSVYDGTADDHGTHVAGTIGGQGGNGIGVAGINWNVKLLDAKFLGLNGGTTANAVKAVDYFTDLKKKGINIVATNNSWGGGVYTQALADAISRANSADILFVAAAGNNSTNNDSVASWPSNYDFPNVIAVAAIDSAGALASFSSYGATTVDLGAPGVGVWSTVPNNSYASYSGTSMATPHVAGAVAFLKSLWPNATGAQIKQALLEGSVPTASLIGKTLTGGRLHLPLASNRLGQILSNPATPLPTISVSTIDGNGSETGPDPLLFRLTRSGDLTRDLNVNLAWLGTAANGTDYLAQPATAIIPANTSSVDITVTPIDDLAIEGPETVNLRIYSGIDYVPNFAAASANGIIADNDQLTEFWGTSASDSIFGDNNNNLIAGVTKTGRDNGRGRIDTLTGQLGSDLFVLADRARGTLYNDGSNRSQGTGDYALIADFKLDQVDKLQLRSGAQYLIQNSGLDTIVYLGDNNNIFTVADEMIARLSGINLAPAGTTVPYIVGNIASSSAWTSYV